MATMAAAATMPGARDDYLTVKFEKTGDDYLAAKLGELATTILWPNRGNAQ
jgi:hypothetical protein